MQSLDEIYQSYALTVYKYLLSLCRNDDLAEELTQETFYQAIKSIHRFDGNEYILDETVKVSAKFGAVYYLVLDGTFEEGFTVKIK